MLPQAYQTSKYVVPCGGIFLGKWRSTVAGNSDGETDVQSACALNTLYMVRGIILGVSLHSLLLMGQHFALLSIALLYEDVCEEWKYNFTILNFSTGWR
jgi:hypothetical protein